MADDIGKAEAGGRRSAPEPLPDSAGPLDIAMAEEAHDAAADSPARTVLLKHAQLQDQQLRQGRMTLVRERMKLLRDLSIAATVALVAGGAGWIIWDAKRADGIVVERFSVPPEMAQQGLTGEVVANRLLDHVTVMDGFSRGEALLGRAARSSGGDMRIEIPQSGISLGEVTRHLRRRIGRERTVSGEVWRRGDRLIVTARVSGSPGDVVIGDPADPERAIKVAAEKLFQRTQPLRYARYLLEQDRGAEGLAVVKRVAEQGGKDQAWGYAFWGTGLWAASSDPRAFDLLKTALRVDPDLAFASATLAGHYGDLGEPQERYRYAEMAERSFRKRRADVDPKHLPFALRSMRSLKARTTGDYLSAATENCRAADRGINLPDARRSCARYLAQVHDVRGALDALAMTPAETPAERNFHAFIRMLIATSERDPTEAAAIEAYARGFVARGGGRQRRVPTLIWPNLAIAHARAGRIPEAQALVARTPGCYDCLVARAVVARFARDWPSSERWFTQATRRGPRVPFAYYAWGEARLARGDVEGALRMLREARERGPGWAEPLKLEGDILLRRGEARAALGKFEAAAERAPRWGALHLAWGRTLEESGRDEEARAKYAEAARLHLSAADRAAVQRLLARPAA